MTLPSQGLALLTKLHAAHCDEYCGRTEHTTLCLEVRAYLLLSEGREKPIDWVALREEVYAAHREKLVRLLPETATAFSVADSLAREAEHHRAAHPKGNMQHIMFRAAALLKRQAEQIGLLTPALSSGSRPAPSPEAIEAAQHVADGRLGGFTLSDTFIRAILAAAYAIDFPSSPPSTP